MANEKEPQSYGSGGDWVTGDVGEEVNRLKGHPSSQHGDFYESRHDSERSAPEQGGKVSPQPAASNDAGSAAPVNKVTKAMGGAKRGGFFRDRDYK